MFGEALSLFLLETVRREFQRAAILCHRAHDVFGSSSLYRSFDLERDCHGRSDQPHQMRDHFVRDTPCIAADPSGIPNLRNHGNA